MVRAVFCFSRETCRRDKPWASEFISSTNHREKLGTCQYKTGPRVEQKRGCDVEIELVDQRFLDEAAQGGILENTAPIEIPETARGFAAAAARDGRCADSWPREVRADLVTGEQNGTWTYWVFPAKGTAVNQRTIRSPDKRSRSSRPASRDPILKCGSQRQLAAFPLA